MIDMLEMRKRQVNRLQWENERIRNDTIEECMQVTELHVNGTNEQIEKAREIYDAIRALKDQK